MDKYNTMVDSVYNTNWKNHKSETVQ